MSTLAESLYIRKERCVYLCGLRARVCSGREGARGEEGEETDIDRARRMRIDAAAALGRREPLHGRPLRRGVRFPDCDRHGLPLVSAMPAGIKKKA